MLYQFKQLSLHQPSSADACTVSFLLYFPGISEFSRTNCVFQEQNIERELKIVQMDRENFNVLPLRSKLYKINSGVPTGLMGFQRWSE